MTSTRSTVDDSRTARPAPRPAPSSDRTPGPAQPPPQTRSGIPGRYWAIGAGVAFVALALITTGIRGLPKKGSSHFRLDPVLHTPLPPTDSPYYGGRTAVVVVVMTLFGLIGLGASVYFARKARSVLPVVLTISGAVIVVPEVMVDVLGLVYYPTSASDNVYTILGRQMGIFIFAGWFGYASLAYWMFQVLERRTTTKMLWVMLGVAGIADVVFEEFILHMGMYVYYGRQPLVIISYLPWWWIPCNSVGIFLAAALTYRLRDRLQGWNSLWTLLMTPLSVGAVYGGIALPSFIVTNGDYPWLVTQIAGLVTVALGIVAFAGVLKFVLNRDPFDMSGHSALDEAEAKAAV